MRRSSDETLSIIFPCTVKLKVAEKKAESEQPADVVTKMSPGDMRHWAYVNSPLGAREPGSLEFLAPKHIIFRRICYNKCYTNLYIYLSLYNCTII